MKNIYIKGAREHNLKNIEIAIPKEKLVVITGVSGSGKSSLAFDTIYAEGQRRYVESLSAYARQFLGIMSKPDVDFIRGLSPAISISQKTTSHNPRSTVGTITEIYDYLRLLFARIGHPHCPNCGREISRLSLDEIINKVFQLIKEELNKDKIKSHYFSIYSPIVRQQKGEFKELFKNLKRKGYYQVLIDNQNFNLEKDEINLIRTNKHTMKIFIDRLVVNYHEFKDKIFQIKLRSRLAQSLEQALQLANGLVEIYFDKNKQQLFSEKLSCPQCNISLPEIEPRMFSFNSPLGACPRCKGLGTIFKIEPKSIIRANLTINEGGLLPYANIYTNDTWYIRLLKQVSSEEGIDLNLPIKKIPADKLNILLFGNKQIYKVNGTNRFGHQTVIYEHFHGIISDMEKHFFGNGSKEISRNEINKYFTETECPLCHGQRLKTSVLAITIDGKNISQLTKKSIKKLRYYFEKSLTPKLTLMEKKIARMIIREIVHRLSFLDNVGLGYLTLNRKAKTLSGGELQRIRLASQIGTGLTGVLYVLDEPSVGLHPRDVKALISSLKKLTKIGNSLLVVEHDRETIENADHIIELGPKAGRMGGKITFQGNLATIKKSSSLTGQYLSGRRKVSFNRHPLNKFRGEIRLSGAKKHNLKNVTISLPLGNLIAVTGVSGSGKSSLIADTLYPALKYYLSGRYAYSGGDFDRLEGYQNLNRVYLVDQSAIGKTPRSNPATYIGLFDEIREIFAQTIEAKARGYNKGRFSFNLKGGRCEKCHGGGLLKIEMQFLADVYIPCDLCQGKRYNQETLTIKYKDKNIYEILEMTVDEATDFFHNHYHLYQKLKLLQDVGLGYIKLGQPAPTFSGGEAQRIKLANELTRSNHQRTLYILDEPTTGLHFFDIEKLLQILHRLVEKGNTVVIIEHNLDIIKNCPYIIDLGPEGGEKGGEIVYQGPREGILKIKKSYTAKYLASSTV